MPLLERLQIALESSAATERETQALAIALLVHSADLAEATCVLQSTSHTLRSLAQGTSCRAAKLGVAALEASTGSEQYLGELSARMRGTNELLRRGCHMLQRYGLLRADIAVIASFPLENQPRLQVGQRLQALGSAQAELVEFFGSVVSALEAELQECRSRTEVVHRARSSLLRGLITTHAPLR